MTKTAIGSPSPEDEGKIVELAMVSDEINIANEATVGESNQVEVQPLPEDSQNEIKVQQEQTVETVKDVPTTEKFRDENKYKAEWHHPEDILSKVKPPFVHTKVLFETDTRFIKQGRKILISDINPRSYFVALGMSELDEALKMSIDDVGLLSPITVRPFMPKVKNGKKVKKKDNYRYTIMDGAARVRALRAKGEELVDAYVIETDDKNLATVMQADLKIVRRELTKLEKITWLKKRKSSYEKLYPETKAESRRQLGLNVSDERISLLKRHESFTKVVSNLTGENVRTVQLYSQVGDLISEELLNLVKGSKIENNFTELRKLAEIKKADLQEKVLDSIINGNAENVNEALGLFTDRVMLIPDDVNKVDTVSLKNAKAKIKKLEKEVSRLKGEIEQMKTIKGENVPALRLYPCTEMNTESIQSEGGQDEQV